MGNKSGSVKEKFSTALSALVERVKLDRSILAAILCGSLSHDTVWEKSDIDLVLVTADEKKRPELGLSLYADGINVHAILMPRAEFRKTAEGAIRNSFQHSMLAKGRLLYTHDETITALCEQLRAIGERDTQLQLLSAASHALPSVYKANKWFLTRGDLDYTALWILYSANSLARVEVLEARRLLDREALPVAMELNPTFFKTVYTDMLNAKKTVKSVQAALCAIDSYLAKRAPAIFAPVIDHLREVREARSATEIENYFERTFGIRGVSGVCEYLADQGILGKAPLPVRLTKNSNIDVEELAFFYAGEASDDW
uniref:Polymerase beta nucleotidyltransferase domain-containing protein n=1 Tax=Solibacter usitatus (strain Ellin6076) TaxID=234267 RepID=Q027K2_SOLUE